jgi:transposase
MPDVSSTAPAEVKSWVALDVHKNSIVAAILPASGDTPRLARIETTGRAIGRFVRGLGDPAAIALCYEAGPCGYELLHLLARLGVACDVVAPSLVPVQAGRPATSTRDACS